MKLENTARGKDKGESTETDLDISRVTEFTDKDVIIYCIPSCSESYPNCQ